MSFEEFVAYDKVELYLRLKARAAGSRSLVVQPNRLSRWKGYGGVWIRRLLDEIEKDGKIRLILKNTDQITVEFLEKP